MSRNSDDRNSELRALFFESAAELLQSLNEAGLQLEARPSDEEVIRRIRLAVAKKPAWLPQPVMVNGTGVYSKVVG